MRASLRFGGLDIVHNNAGFSPEADTDVASMDAQTWTAVMDVDALGALLVTKHAIPHLRRRGGGSIINTSSITALAGDLIHTSYGMAKAALCSLTQHVAVQYGRENIRCNVICPALTLTPAALLDLPAPLIRRSASSRPVLPSPLPMIRLRSCCSWPATSRECSMARSCTPTAACSPSNPGYPPSWRWDRRRMATTARTPI